MPNSYCRGSKLTDEVFEVILFCFLDGQSLEKAIEEIEEKWPAENPPTVKTVSRHFDRIGLALFAKTIGDQWHEKNPKIFAVKESNLKAYMQELDKFTDQYHFSALDPYNDDIPQPLDAGGKKWAYSDEAKEYCEFSKKRYGVLMRARGHLGLAAYRTEYRSTPNGEKTEKEFTANDLERLYEDIKKMLLKNRC